MGNYTRNWTLALQLIIFIAKRPRTKIFQGRGSATTVDIRSENSRSDDLLYS
jgi:hypothetical protein